MNTKRELARQLVHFSGLVFIPISLSVGNVGTATLLAALGVFTFLLGKTEKTPLAVFFPLRHLLAIATALRRENEAGYEGALWFFLSLSAVFFLFPGEIPEIACFALCVYDSVSSLAGMFIGKTRVLRGKTLEGTLAGFAVSLAAGSPLFGLHTMLPASAVAALAELTIPVNDNLSIPFSVSIVLFMLNCVSYI